MGAPRSPENHRLMIHRASNRRHPGLGRRNEETSAPDGTTVKAVTQDMIEHRRLQVEPASGASLGSTPPWCCTSTTLSIFLLGSKCRARIQPEAGRTLAGEEDLTAWGNCMGETLLLISCGAAFITGLVIAVASLSG
jgi:hypothetical protein